ncbi:MAG: DUF2339 domain-containing protein [Paludibacteraceae bacterium]|nr:DUF2339 domain-containing protein [Paludibacteraceae bacterium]
MGNTKYFDRIISISIVILLTIVIYICFTAHIRTMLWAVETLLLYFLMSKKEMLKGEWLVGCLLTVTSISYICLIVANAKKDDGFSTVLNITTVIYALCAGGLLYFSRKRKSDGLFVDAVIWALLLSPIATLFFKIDYYDMFCREYRRVLLGYFATLYFFAHRNNWEGFPVKLMSLLRIMIFIAVGDLIELSYDVDDPNYPCMLRYTLIAILTFSLYLVYLYRNSAYRLVKKIPEILHKFGADTFVIVVVWLMLTLEMCYICDVFHFNRYQQKSLVALWAIYALILIFIGIVKNIKYIRIEGITLFSLTLVKMFFTDFSDFDTFSKIIALISIGTWLIIVRFFYQRNVKKQVKQNAEVGITEEKGNNRR